MIEQFEKIVRDRFNRIPVEAAAALVNCQSEADAEKVLKAYFEEALQDLANTKAGHPLVTEMLQKLNP